MEKGEGAAGSGTTSRGGSLVFFVLPLWTGHCREREEHLLALTSLGTVSEQRKSTIPSRCQWWVIIAPMYRGFTVGLGIVLSTKYILAHGILTANLCVPIL